MLNLLAKLKQAPGVRGALVIDRDGMVVASEWPSNLEATSSGAVASGARVVFEEAARRLELGKIQRCVVKGKNHQLAFLSADQVLLLVLLDHSVDLKAADPALQAAIKAINKRIEG
jgi:predicted regulator of Ras-like GTPase activity (Roadblock/LC7/MglB family)